MSRHRKGRTASKTTPSIDVISQDIIKNNLLLYIRESDHIGSLVNHLFDGQSNISDIAASDTSSLKTQQNLVETKDDLKRICTYIIYSIEPQTFYLDANQPSAQDKLHIMDSFNYALNNHSILSEEEIIELAIKFDHNTGTPANRSDLFKACSQIKECCLNGATEEVSKFLDYLTSNIVTKGVDLGALGYLSRVEEIKKSDHGKTDEKGIDTIDVKILRDSQIYRNEQKHREGKQDSTSVVRFEEAADSKAKAPSPIVSEASQSKFTESAKDLSRGSSSY